MVAFVKCSDHSLQYTGTDVEVNIPVGRLSPHLECKAYLWTQVQCKIILNKV